MPVPFLLLPLTGLIAQVGAVLPMLLAVVGLAGSAIMLWVVKCRSSILVAS